MLSSCSSCVVVPVSELFCSFLVLGGLPSRDFWPFYVPLYLLSLQRLALLCADFSGVSSECPPRFGTSPSRWLKMSLRILLPRESVWGAA